MNATFKSKQDALLNFLDQGMTMVHLDARRDGVVVPKSFVGQQDLRLNLSYRFSNTQMDITDDRVEATLTFGGAPFRCSIPFTAVYALTSHVSGAGLVFPESLPEDLLAALKREIDADGEIDGEEALEAQTLSIMPSQSGDEGLPQDTPMPTEGRPTKAPHLRVIEGDKK